MYIYSNPHPKGKRVGDCVKRAIVHATGLDYMDVQRQLNRFKRSIGGSGYNKRDTWPKFIEEVLGGIPIKIEVIPGQPRINGETFGLYFPKGKYILRMAHHLSCCIDGNLIDSWDCSEKCVYKAYKIL